MSKHTAAPWTWADHYEGLYGQGADNAVLNYAPYEGLWIHGATVEQEKANARVLAAAPELLAALKALLPGAESMGWDTTAARAAIAKAES